MPNTVSLNDKYVLSHEHRLVYKIWNNTERTLTSAANISGDIWGATVRKLTSSWTDEASPVQIATKTDLDNLETNLRGADSEDLTTLAGYVDSVEGYIGAPDDLATDDTLFGRVKDVREKLDQLDTLESKLDTVDGIIDTIRAS